MTELRERKRIGQGRTAEIFEWDERQVLKLFHAGFPAEWIAYEAEAARLAHQAGLAAPATAGTLTLDGRTGILYERIDGVSMLQTISSKPWMMPGAVRQIVEVQLAMHRCVCRELPSQRERLARSIQTAPALAAESKDHLLRILSDLPDGEAVCHGDYHPDNILMSPRGPIVIDWMTATRGNPLADVARTSLMARSPGLPHWIGGFDRQFIRFGQVLFHASYLKEYQRRHPLPPGQLEAWMPIQAAARLIERIPGEEAWLLALIDRRIEKKHSNSKKVRNAK